MTVSSSNSDYWAKLEHYELDVLVLGPGEKSRDILMQKKRNELILMLDKMEGIKPKIFTSNDVQSKDWATEVSEFANKADYVFYLASPSVSVFLEGVFILPSCHNKFAAFYNNSELQKNDDLASIINSLRREKLQLLGFHSERIIECRVCNMAQGIVYRLLQEKRF